MRFWRILWRACRLRCPRCGTSRLFRGWFRMFPRCERCGLAFQREGGYYLGAIYINYGLTALLMTIAYPVLWLTTDISPDVFIWPLLGFCLVFPLWFFHYARALWLGMDEFFDPQRQESAEASPPQGSDGTPGR